MAATTSSYSSPDHSDRAGTRCSTAPSRTFCADSGAAVDRAVPSPRRNSQPPCRSPSSGSPSPECANRSGSSSASGTPSGSATSTRRCGEVIVTRARPVVGAETPYPIPHTAPPTNLIDAPPMPAVGVIVVKRAPRRPAPEVPAGELAVDAPPEIPQATGSRWQQALQVLPMLTGTIPPALLFGQRGGGTYQYVIGGIFGISTLGMLATSMSNAGPKKAEMIAARREYLRHLATLRKRVRETAEKQRDGLFYRHPDPDRLWSTVDSHRLWERRATDGDFGIVRVAVGAQSLATPLVPPATRPLEDLEPMTAGALRRFLDAYSVVPDLPIAVSLRGFARVFVRGADDDARALTRAVLAQLAVFHAPDDLIIAVCAGSG